MKKEPLDEIPPFTLEIAEEEIKAISDSAWVAGARAAAVEFVMGNLLIELNKSGVIDVLGVIRRLQDETPRLEAPARIAAEGMLQGFYEAVSDEDQGGYVLH